MKREIKFRAWDIPAKKYRGVDGLKDLFSIRSDGFFNEDYVLEQFTGLKDKNGVDIYEGDIVKYNKQNIEVRYFDNYGMFGLVGSNNYASKVIDESKPMGSRGSSTSYKPYVLSDFYQKRIEIIGNIHENPELLNPSNK